MTQLIPSPDIAPPATAGERVASRQSTFRRFREWSRPRLRRLGFRMLRGIYFSGTVGLLFAGVLLAIAVCRQMPLVGLALAILCGTIIRRLLRKPDTDYGTARWAGLRDLVWGGYLFPSAGTVVGRVIHHSEATPWLALETLARFPRHADEQAVRIARAIHAGTIQQAPIRLAERDMVHTAVYARSGGGKSKCHAIPNLLTDPSAAVVIDVKGELAAETARHRAEMFGHEIVCIAPFGGAPAEFPPHAFNPLSVVNLQSPHLVSDAIHFAKALIRPDRQDHNPFFVKSAMIVLDAVLSFMLCHVLPAECTLQKLREITVNPQALRKMADLMLRSNFAGGHLQLKAQQVTSLTGKTLMDVLATLNTQLFWIDSEAIANATHWTTFDVQKLLDGRVTIYLIFPTDRVDDYAGLIRVWITALAHAIFSAGIGRSQTVRFYFDEASLLGQDMPVLERMLTKGRGYGIKSCWYWQSLHQIQEVFPEHLAQVFREQMSAEQFLEISNYQTAKEVSQWIGQTTIRVQNESSTRNWSSSHTNGHHPSTTSGWSASTTSGYQKTGRALIQPEELLQLPEDATLVLKPQFPPILARKIKSFDRTDKAELLIMAERCSARVRPMGWRRCLAWLLLLLWIMVCLAMSWSGNR